jgi:Ni,Fe-hydrogenase I large subunit
MDRDITKVGTVGEGGVAEAVAHSHYEDDAQALRQPRDGRTLPRYAGPPAPVATIADATKYSWSKAPRYDDDPMEVGPLARMAVAHARGGGTLVGAAVADVLADLDFGAEMLFGTLGRTIARAIEARVIVDRLEGWLVELGENLAARDTAVANLSGWDPARWAGEAEGRSLGESPQGALGHWLTIRDRRIGSYQVVDASTWNASPRDGRGRRGAMEQALIGTPVADPDRPLEILRTVHSFDPCMACAVH